MSEPKTFQERQALLNRLLDAAARDYKSINKKYMGFALAELERIKNELIGLLLRYSDGEKITVQRLILLLQDIERVRNGLNMGLTNVLHETIQESAKYGTVSSNKNIAIATSTEVADFAYIPDKVFQYVVNRFGTDGLVLSDRIWRLSNEQKSEIEKIIRTGIVTGRNVASMVRQINKVYELDRWKIERLVITEGNTAYRTASAYVAQESKTVQGLQIHRGRANRPNHRCTQLEHIDRYGLGAGVFIPTDTEVLNPHPLCTSHTTYVLKEVSDSGVIIG